MLVFLFLASLMTDDGERISKLLVVSFGEGAHQIEIDDRDLSFVIEGTHLIEITIDGASIKPATLSRQVPELVGLLEERAKLRERRLRAEIDRKAALELAEHRRLEGKKLREEAEALQIEAEKLAVRSEEMAEMRTESAERRRAELLRAKERLAVEEAALARRQEEIRRLREHLKSERQLLEKERARLKEERTSLETITNRFRKDGLIGDDYSLRIDLDKSLIEIDGKQLSTEQFERYREFLEEHLGDRRNGRLHIHEHR